MAIPTANGGPIDANTQIRPLSVVEALTYFATEPARIARYEGQAANWLLSDGYVGTGGAFNVLPVGGTVEIGRRLVVEIATDKLQEWLDAIG